MKIYQILLDRFKSSCQDISRLESTDAYLGGNLQGAESALPRIQSMGFDAILVSPVITSLTYHGYHALR